MVTSSGAALLTALHTMSQSMLPEVQQCNFPDLIHSLPESFNTLCSISFLSKCPPLKVPNIIASFVLILENKSGHKGVIPQSANKAVL